MHAPHHGQHAKADHCKEISVQAHWCMYVSPGEGTARKSAHECTSLGTLNWRYAVAQDLRKLQNVCTRFFALRFCVYAANASPLPLETKK